MTDSRIRTKKFRSVRQSALVTLSALLLFHGSISGAAASDQGEEGAAKEPNEAGDNSAEEEKQGFWSRFKDPEDGKFDVTAASSAKGEGGFVPLVIPFNEPAIGVGLVAAIAYIHPRKESESGEHDRTAPPSTTVGGVMYSENGTWGGAAGHLGIWKQGRIRYRGLVGYADANLEYYGTGRDPDLNQNPIPFNIKGGGIVQQGAFKLGKSRLFVGGRYSFASTDTEFESDPDLDEEGAMNNAGVTAFVSVDSRDNIFTPNKGTNVKAAFTYYSTVFGGDFDYGRLDVVGHQYWSLLKKRLIFGVRLEYHHAGNESPFWALPYVKLRGIPAFRYLGNYVVTGEIEPRWKIDNRWSVLAFAGSGRGARNLDRLKDAERAYNIGSGFRYLLARKLGLAGGIDVARGPEETTFYIIFGSAWGL